MSQQFCYFFCYFIMWYVFRQVGVLNWIAFDTYAICNSKSIISSYVQLEYGCMVTNVNTNAIFTYISLLC